MADEPRMILVVDDEAEQRRLLSGFVQSLGFRAELASSAEEALEIVRSRTPDMVLLDVRLPGMSGIEALGEIRKISDKLPVLLITAYADVRQAVAAVKSGADDYLAKPFEPSELLARVRAVLRRAEAFTFGEPQSQLSVEGFRLDPVNNTVTMPTARTVELTPIEFRLLHTLVRNNGRVLTHEQLISTVWGYDYEGYSNQVAVYVRRLRSKMEPDPDAPRYIVTARGLGYKFEAGG